MIKILYSTYIEYIGYYMVSLIWYHFLELESVNFTAI